jgi:hypothetical protein
MIGGGTWTSQNKVLPGAYINFASAARASAVISDRGVCALPVEMNWGADNTVITLNAEDFETESLAILGYSATSDELKGIRDAFKYAKTVHLYRLNTGVNASGDFATAKCSGKRGNDIKIVISANVDDAAKFDVATYLDTTKVDTQTVAKADELVDNDFVTFKKDATLAATAGIALTGGTNGEVTGAEHQKALGKLESLSFNTLGCLSDEASVKGLYASFTKRMRDEIGVKFQTVIYNYDSDYHGIINVATKALNADAQSLVYWVTGAEAGCAVNKSLTNMIYNGEFEVDTDLKQSELAEALKNGKFVFHKVGTNVCVLDDINSFVSVSVDMNEDFKMNQVIRVLDQIANDIALTFNTKYLGKVQNNAAGRISFWSDVVDIHNQLQNIGAIEDFTGEDVKVDKGTEKNAVIETESCKPVCAMEKLYMKVSVV